MTLFFTKKRPRKPGLKKTLDEVMTTLEAMGTAQNRKIYARHGAGENMFGVSHGNLNKLMKEIKMDGDLAKALWDTGNMDAMTLAFKIADPEMVCKEEADQLVRKMDYYMLSDYLVSEVVIYRDYALDLMHQWMADPKEFVQRSGWCILSSLARAQKSLDDAVFEDYIKRIEADIHQAPNRTRQMMNICLLNIGLREPLHQKALDAARRIGPVDVDHGDTSCKTTDTPALLSDDTYLMRARKSLKWSA